MGCRRAGRWGPWPSRRAWWRSASRLSQPWARERSRRRAWRRSSRSVAPGWAPSATAAARCGRRRRRCSRGRGSSAVDAERDLIEVDLVQARDLAIVIRAAAALQALDDLAVAGGHGEGLTPGRDLGVATIELQGGLASVALGALDPGLGGQQIGPRRTGAQRRAESGLAGRRSDQRRLAQHGLAAQAMRELAGKLLAGTLFHALAQGPHAFEAELEGRMVHERVDRPVRRGLERLDARWVFTLRIQAAAAQPPAPSGATPSRSASSWRPRAVTATARMPD